MAPIAYDPPWTNEIEHMRALKALADPAYPGYNFDFIFQGDTVSSYANAIAGQDVPYSQEVGGKDVYLHFETIFNHEFGHVMAIAHHYDVYPTDGPKYCHQARPCA